MLSATRQLMDLLLKILQTSLCVLMGQGVGQLDTGTRTLIGLLIHSVAGDTAYMLQQCEFVNVV